jgi:ATP-binding cassette subfamily F protein uup
VGNKAPGSNDGAGAPKASAARKLNNKEQRELDGLPAKLAQLEQEQATLRAELNDVNLYTKDPLKAGKLYQRDAAIEDEMLSLLARWEALSEV